MVKQFSKNSPIHRARRKRHSAGSRRGPLEKCLGMKKRHAIPGSVADGLLYEADRTCCICHSPHKAVQLHHIDGNPGNKDPRNLAVLCLDHHDEASKGPGHGRGLTPRQIRKYMDNWLRTVKVRRATEAGARTHPTVKIAHELIMDALSAHEIRKVRSRLIAASWDKRLQLLVLLDPYTDFRYGYDARIEFLYTLSDLADQTRTGMTHEVADMINQLAVSILPIFSLQRPANRKPKKKDIRLLRQAIHIGSTMAYDAAKYLRDMRVAAAGANVLWEVLRFAHVNKLRELKREVLSEFRSLENEAEVGGFSEGKRWFEFECLDALALEGHPQPKLPAGIAANKSQIESKRIT